jgi:hypothetical protein
VKWLYYIPDDARIVGATKDKFMDFYNFGMISFQIGSVHRLKYSSGRKTKAFWCFRN